MLITLHSQAATTPLPDDLQLVPPDALPTQATWLSIKYWGAYPPSPFNWLAGTPNVLYYRSASYGTNFILIDDTQLPALTTDTVQPLDSSGPPFPGPGNTGTNSGGGGYVGPKFTQTDI